MSGGRRGRERTIGAPFRTVSANRTKWMGFMTQKMRQRLPHEKGDGDGLTEPKAQAVTHPFVKMRMERHISHLPCDWYSNCM